MLSEKTQLCESFFTMLRDLHLQNCSAKHLDWLMVNWKDWLKANCWQTYLDSRSPKRSGWLKAMLKETVTPKVRRWAKRSRYQV